MTLLKLDELAQLNTLDQVLLWTIVSINDANIDSRNPFIADSAAIRAESADYIQWSVTQDDKGYGRFIFTVLLPVVNPQPLQDKASLLERIWSYSPYEPDQEFDAGIAGYGTGIPILPAWIDTAERLLAYVGIIGTLIGKYARLTRGDEAFWAEIKPEYWADMQYKISDSAYGGNMTISGSMYIDWGSYIGGLSLIKCLNPDPARASDVSCNFPLLSLLWDTPDEIDPLLPPSAIDPLVPVTGEYSLINGVVGKDLSGTATGLINSYDQPAFNDDALPDWYRDALNTRPDSRPETQYQDNWDNSVPPIIESLGGCKEQDPSIISYANNLGDALPKK